MTILPNEVKAYISSNLTEDAPLWIQSATYQNGAETMWDHYVYKYSGVNGTNTQDNPANDSVWVKDRPANYNAMLDNETETQTVNADKIEVEFTGNGYDKLSLLGLEAKSVSITITSTVDPTLTRTTTYDLVDTDSITNLEEYCTKELSIKDSLYVELPVFYAATIKVVINHDGNNAKCGRLVCGHSFYVGVTQWDIGLGLSSYSVKNQDDFGITTFIHRGALDRDDFKVSIETNRALKIKAKAKELDAKPVLFVIVEKQDLLVLNFGYWEEFYTLLSGPVRSVTNITARGIL